MAHDHRDRPIIDKIHQMWVYVKRRIKIYWLGWFVYKVGRIVRDCNYHPCRITEVWDYETDLGIEMVSLLTGKETSCSANNCSPARMSQYEIDNSIIAFEEDGERGLLILNGWPPAEADKFIAIWRTDAV